MRFPTRALIYLGVGFIVAGFALIAFTWGRMAALTAVPLQMPYLVSGGLTAVGLLIVGVTLINIQTKLADAQRRDRQIQQLSELLDQIRILLGGEDRISEQEVDTADDDARSDRDSDVPWERRGDADVDEDDLSETSEIPVVERQLGGLVER